MKNTNELIEKWVEYVGLRNSYTFGDEDVSLEDFAELARDTYEVIKKAREYVFENNLPKATEVFSYLSLVSEISKYTTYDCTEDESDDKTFTATCLVALGLVEYATNGAEESSGGNINYLYNKMLGEAIVFFGKAEDGAKNVFTYNVYTGDFSGVLELAQMMEV